MSPQWDSNSKAFGGFVRPNENMFQSPQWGSNSKVLYKWLGLLQGGFSPRNGGRK